MHQSSRDGGTDRSKYMAIHLMLWYYKVYGVQARAEELADHEEHCMHQSSRDGGTDRSKYMAIHLMLWYYKVYGVQARAEELADHEEHCMHQSSRDGGLIAQSICDTLIV